MDKETFHQYFTNMDICTIYIPRIPTRAKIVGWISVFILPDHVSLLGQRLLIPVLVPTN